MAEAAGGLTGLKAGDPFVVISTDPQHPNPRNRTVAKVGRVWVTDTRGGRYTIDGGEPDDTAGYPDRAMTVQAWDQMAERARLLDVLRHWGLWNPYSSQSPRTLDDNQLRQVAELLTAFELIMAGPE
jgi:hypothetical protein